jgi:hypothetical protein
MQPTFYCPWCLTRKPVATGFKQIGTRRRKCLQCHHNTMPPTARHGGEHKRITP